MPSIIRVDRCNCDFPELVSALDADLAIRDGDEHEFYHQFNGIEDIKYRVVVYAIDRAVGCAAIKAYDDETYEIKRMYVHKDFRGRGMAKQMLMELERWAAELGAKRTILETGKMQPEAIGLYQSQGYVQVENYGQYKGVENSLCFQKQLER